MAGTVGGSEQPRLPLRASDAERDEAVAALRERFAAGQLSQSTFVGRMEAALGARDRRELADLFADLGAPRRRRAAACGGLGRRLAAAAWRLRKAAVRPALREPAVRPALREPAVRPALREPAVRPALRAAAPAPEDRPAGLIFPAGGQMRFTIGRDPDCDLVIADPSVSRWHAGLDRGADGWRLRDLGSTNGTRLNGWRVRDPVPVRCGDWVSFGAVTFVLSDRAVGLPVA